jgi:hypothetical protein
LHNPLELGYNDDRKWFGTLHFESGLWVMIDDYAKAMELVRKMEAHLPIPARPTGAYIRAMRERGVQVAVMAL